METKEKILEAALELFVEYGLYGVATSKISKKAGVSAGILFHHFETKDKLISELYAQNKARYMQEALDNIPENASTEKKLLMYWENMLLKCSTNPMLSKFCRQIEHSPFIEKVREDERVKCIIDSQQAIFKQGIENGILKDFPVDYLADLFGSMQGGTVIFLHSKPELLNDPSFIENAWLCVWDAIKR